MIHTPGKMGLSSEDRKNELSFLHQIKILLEGNNPSGKIYPLHQPVNLQIPKLSSGPVLFHIQDLREELREH